MSKTRKNSTIILGRSYMEKIIEYKEEGEAGKIKIKRLLESLGVDTSSEDGLEPTDIKLTISSDDTINYNGTIQLTANLSNKNSAFNTTWEILSDGANYVRLDNYRGSKVTLISTIEPTEESYNGTISIGNNQYDGYYELIANATLGGIITSRIENKIIEIEATNPKASNSPVTKEIEIIGKEETTEDSQVESYAWEIINGASYAILENANNSTCIVRNNNNTSSNQTVTLKCKVTWDNGISKYSSPMTLNMTSSTIPEEPEYYWYVGTSKPTVVNGTIANAETDIWTPIGTTKPNQIYIESADDYTFPKWYVAIPTEFNFQPYDMTGTELELGAWEDQQDTTTLAEYTIWILANNDASLKSVFK